MIKNLIFDFGNVLFDLDLPATERVLAQHVGLQLPNAIQQLHQQKTFQLYETGGLTTPDFLEAVSHTFAPPLSTTQIEEAWNAIFIGMPAERFTWLAQLRPHYNLFLLSNINDLHARWIDDYMRREHNLPDFRIYFDGVYYSHLIRLRKPDHDIYEYVLADAELQPHESVFFDDLLPNVEAARAVGIHAVQHPVGADIRKTVADFLSSVGQ